jgi:hypothetical protein
MMATPPSGTSPVSTQRHRAIASLPAKAHDARIRLDWPVIFWMDQCESGLAGCLMKSRADYDDINRQMEVIAKNYKQELPSRSL